MSSPCSVSGDFCLLPLAALILILVILALDHKKTAKPKESKAEAAGYDYASATPEKTSDTEIHTLVQDYLTARAQAMQRSSIGFSDSPTKRARKIKGADGGGKEAL